MTNNNQILHGGQTTRVENFYQVDHVQVLPWQKFVSQTLTINFFAVANLLGASLDKWGRKEITYAFRSYDFQNVPE